MEIRKQTMEGGEFHIVGYAATSDFDMQGDIITEEALQASSLDLVKNSTVLLNHDIKIPIGKVTKAEFDKHGLLIDVLISKTEPDIIQKIKEGVLNKFSIRGEVLEREKKYMPEVDRVVNVIKRMSLIEVSLVSVPANPEAKAIGWYVSKALQQSEEKQPQDVPADIQPQKSETGGQPMADKEKSKSVDPSEDVKPNPAPDETKPDGKEEAAPAAEQKQPETEEPKGDPAPEKTDPAPEEKTPEPQMELSKQNVSKAQLALIWPLLDRLAEVGGEAGPLAIQTKALLKWMVGDVAAPPVIPAPAPKAPSDPEIGKKIADEVKKQLEAALKNLPAQRKGLVPPEPAADELKKTFEGLPPEKKLRVALSLQ